MNDPKNIFSNSKATSPVIGIMLMVVVTVILAAAVSSYSSGMMKSTEVAPTAMFDVKVVKDLEEVMGDYTYIKSFIVIKEVTGDSIPTKDLKIVTVNPNTDCNFTTMEILPGVENADFNNGWSDKNGIVPFDNNPVNGYFGDSTDEGSLSKNFGNYTLRPGVSMVADQYSNYVGGTWNPDTGEYENGATGMQAMFADWSSIDEGDFVTVKIVHIPSQKVIFQQNVEVM
ncbi:MAG: type IV pilin N-terminal domain-containing protein [Methanosarcinaceae archaeon]|nr:type IV pilin N-terminal domain-containing protein [Methanosarcinaceae archaeon]